jgi:carbon storage regulator
VLVLSRKERQWIDGGRIKVYVVQIFGGKVRLGFEAPKEVTVHRGGVAEAIRKAEETAEEVT